MTRILTVASVVARAAATLAAASILVFLAVQLVPGGFERIYLGGTGSEESYRAIRELLGLDRSLWEQYWSWISGLVTGDLGISLRSARPIVDDLSVRLPVTVHLTILAAIISVPAGLLLGVLTGALGGTRGSIWGRLLGGLSSSVPDFVFGAIVVYMASKIGWRVVGGAYVPFTDDPIASTARMVLPALALSFYAVGVLARTTRDSVLEVRTEPFISTAVAQGDTRLQIVRRHILRNVSNPAVAVTAVNVGYLVGGAVIIERVFALPGIGSYALDAVNARDYPVVLATVMLGTLAFVVANTVSDLLGGVLDPRLGAKRRLTN